MVTEDGTIYGTTVSGGIYDYGTLYKLTPEGNYSILYDFFSPFDGGSPEATLSFGADGKLYGLTTEGGSINYNRKKCSKTTSKSLSETFGKTKVTAHSIFLGSR